MKKLFTFLFFFLCIYSFSQTSIPAGNVSGTWSLAGSPYLIQGDIQILNGQTLTIAPGVTVDFQGTFKFNVQGCLLANGTVTDTIIFTAANTINGWWGIRFVNTSASNSTSNIVYCKLQYGNAIGAGGPPHDDEGGALYILNFSNIIISHSRIINCKANGSGGGIACHGGSPVISNNIIFNNDALVGGGILLDNSSAVISNNTISNNSASLNGGGIRCNNSPLIITNNIIANNTASNNGGGIYCESSNLISTNNTIVNNTAIKGGGLYCFTISNPTLRNTILYGNTANISGGQLFLEDDGSDPDFLYCDVQGSSSAFGLNGNIYSGTYQNNINSTPLFVSPSSGSGSGFDGISADWSLQSGSPCIDNGDMNGTYSSTDILGNPRVLVCRIDMGAYEYQTGASLSVTITQIQQILCYGDASGVLSANPSGGAPSDSYTYAWTPGGQTSQSITGLFAGTYTVTVSTSISQCQTQITYTVGQPAQIILTPLYKDDNGCNTINDGWAKINIAGGTVPFTFLWSNGNSTDSIGGLVSGNYSVTVTDANGCSALCSVLVGSFTNTVTISFISTMASCQNADGSITANPSGGAIPYAYVWSTGNSSQTVSNILAGNYTVSITDKNGCTATGNSTIGTNNTIATPAVCMVTVDSLSKNNVIMWDKTTFAHIDSFIVMRETSANTYSPIGAVPYDSLSLFVDTVRTKYFPNTGDPNTGTYRYKLKMVDSCGNYSQLSPFHNTIYIINNSGTFSWPQLYTIEGSSNPVSNYVLLRDNINNGNWVVVSSVTGTQQTITDPQYATYQATGSWRVETQWSISCSPTKVNPSAQSFNASRSNIFSFVSSVDDFYNNPSVTVSPNPFSETATLQILNGPAENCAFQMLDIYGREVKHSFIPKGEKSIEIDRDGLSGGMYFYKILSENKVIATGKLILQ